MFNGYTSPYPSSTPLHDQGWQSPVTFVITFSSPASGNKAGVVVGLGNGSVQLWNGNLGSINPNSCHKQGQFLQPIAVVVEKSPLEKEWKTLDASAKLRYDVNAIGSTAR